MEVRLNKMEMTVSVCHFYNFFPPSHTSHIITPAWYLWTNAKVLDPKSPYIWTLWLQHVAIYLNYEMHICEEACM